jgi:hypothetical protein
LRTTFPGFFASFGVLQSASLLSRFLFFQTRLFLRCFSAGRFFLRCLLADRFLGLLPQALGRRFPLGFLGLAQSLLGKSLPFGFLQRRSALRLFFRLLLAQRLLRRQPLLFCFVSRTLTLRL